MRGLYFPFDRQLTTNAGCRQDLRTREADIATKFAQFWAEERKLLDNQWL
jgi:hypothetical protein